MSDLTLVFPHQWSPFQPALAMPSLAAWLRRAGYLVTCHDLNIQFYRWLFSSGCTELLLNAMPGEDQLAKLVFSNASDFLRDLERLMTLASGHGALSDRSVLDTYRIANNSFHSYLEKVSEVCEFTVSPYTFSLGDGDLDPDRLESFAETPPEVVAAFCRRAVQQILSCETPNAIGISCIGQEQIYFTLALGKAFKAACSAPVIVGGTIFPRIYERGALPSQWFGKYFDGVVMNEGERPCEQILKNLRVGKLFSDEVDGLIALNQGTVSRSPPSPPLRPHELPIPDFSDLPLDDYFAESITLPILASRGCYWGKCEFCHHGMVYGERYEAYAADQVLEVVQTLSDRYDVRNFAFNDEAIPPKILRKLGKIFPLASVTNWNFTGLIKFEKFFGKDDFQAIADIGFRSLYVGLESASEHVQRLMRKDNLQRTMVSNLKDATDVGIWMHCFLFFGFPGETDADAKTTFDFILEHTDKIGSIGCGVFALEHNAPIFHHVDKYGVTIVESGRKPLDVFYSYAVSNGIGPERARHWMTKLNEAADCIRNYRAGCAVPREHLLCLLSRFSPGTFVDINHQRTSDGKIGLDCPITSILTLVEDREGVIAICRPSLHAVGISGEMGQVAQAIVAMDIDVQTLRNILPDLYRALTGERVAKDDVRPLLEVEM